VVVSSPIDIIRIGGRQIVQLLNRKRWTKNVFIFEKLAFINVFCSQYVRPIPYGLALAGGLKSVQLGKLLHVLGNCSKNVQFYIGNKIKIIFDR
jgi:hypothetical protein